MYNLIAMDKQINIQELLDWYLWAGVNETCGDCPCLSRETNVPDAATDKQVLFQVAVQSPVPVRHTTDRTLPSGGLPISGSTPFDLARKNACDICQKASTLDELQTAMQHFEGCNLKNTAASTVFGDGAANAKLLLIGEAPGADEDRIGKPFVGKCGKLLDKMLASIGVNREECFITNVLPWRPPGNRTPTNEEKAICLPFLLRQIELIQPDFILLLGGIALNSVLDCADSISRVRGKWYEYNITDNKKAQVLATYHPSYLLRSPAQKAKVWADLLRLKNKMSA